MRQEDGKREKVADSDDEHVARTGFVRHRFEHGGAPAFEMRKRVDDERELVVCSATVGWGYLLTRGDEFNRFVICGRFDWNWSVYDAVNAALESLEDDTEADDDAENRR